MAGCDLPDRIELLECSLGRTGYEDRSFSLTYSVTFLRVPVNSFVSAACVFPVARYL